MPVSIRVALAQQQSFELSCGPQSRRVDWEEVESLVATADREYFGGDRADDGHSAPELPQLTALGRKLFQWLDGPEGWLRAGLTGGETTVLLDLAAPLEAAELNPATESLVRKLAHLPWELLNNGKTFLAELGIQPIRVMRSRSTNAQPANRPLRLLFMATSPEDVLPVLEYEREEATILEATRQQPVDLVVEESGSVSLLRNLVASFGKDYFDVFHITGHGAIEDGTPQFVTEDEQGGAQFTTAEQLAEAFGRRWPRLLFLSGCHTAQAPNRGMIPSMAHALVNAGADAVLGWARPVYDTTGIFAANHLYQALATGERPLDAVAATRREMIRKYLQNPKEASCSDWHLLRIYQGVRDMAALVTPLQTPKREQLKRRPPENEFLDAEGNIKVAGASAFIGRRREMQRCLKALAFPSDHYGVFLHGIGGYGKSTIAARLCRRHEALSPGFERVVLIGPVEETRLRQRLSDKFGGIPEVIETLNQPNIEFKQQLTNFFNFIEGQGRRLLLVLDDFEQNIPAEQVANGSLRLVVNAWRALEALCFALEESSAASRLIVTCRYYSPKALPPNRLFAQGLARMAATDIDKKAEALVSGVAVEKRNPKREQKIVEVADGNPRLLERLMALALRPDLIDDAFLNQLGAKLSEFRESILAEKLLGALSEPERKALARVTLFELAVPMVVVADLAQGAPVERAISLGLLEKQAAHGEDLYRVTTVLEPLLRSALSEVEWSEARRWAARKLYAVWWDDPENPREARGLEVVRVAVAAGEQELAAAPADAIALRWINRSRYLEAVALCRFVLAAFEDYRILGTIAHAEEVLGDTVSARSHYEKALSVCPLSDERERASTISNLADLEAQQGNIELALQLWQQSLEIMERIGDVTGKAAALHQMAAVIAQQGDIQRALQLWQQSLEIKERIGNVKGKAATLHDMAGVIAQQGDTERALQLWQQSLEIKGRIGDVKGKAATLHQMAGVIAEQGDIERALQLWQQSLEIKGRIGDVKGKAATLHNMAGVIAQQGDIERALQLWQQSLEIEERIGDVNGKAATLHNMAGVIAHQGDIQRALQLWQQSLEISERIGGVQGKAATLHQMAGVIARQGDMERALQLWQQSLEIHERIGDVQGKAATLANMAWAAGKSGDHARSDQLNRQAATALGSVRAYLDMITVLGNLGASAQDQREIFAAQAAWLVLKVQAPVGDSLTTLSLLFNLVAKGDPLKPLLAAAAMIVVDTRGENQPQREKLREEAAGRISIAAGNAGIQSQEAFQQWFAENRLDDSSYVFPRLLALLEQLVADRWLFDRAPLQDDADSTSAP